ncbi:MAG TPA: EAL domain-containing protein [Nocardioidaceae bacterium]|nr:EAL domain-containing protein [Nocardioidaceae bacterium]
MAPTTTAATATPPASRVFDGVTFAMGMLIFAGAVAWLLGAWLSGPGPAAWSAPWSAGWSVWWSTSWLYLLSPLLVTVVAHFPVLLDRADGGIEIGFDSSVLMFLLCMLPVAEALVLWSIGVTLTQLTTDKRPAARRFNIGLGIIGGAAAAGIITALRGDELSTPHELAAVALGATGYFAIDFLLSAISVGLEESSSVLRQVVQPGSALAVACFVPFDSLGYLAAVVVRSAPTWAALLLAVPLATLLVATRAVTRGQEHARRLAVLFDAAVHAQALAETGKALDVMVEEARRLLHVPHVEVRSAPPGPQEIGAALHDGHRDLWIVAPARHRARSTIAADRQALEAMTAVWSDAFARLRLTEDMTHLARHDALTGLPNRALLLDRVEQALQLSMRRGTGIALLFCDLDGFKRVNDRFGHAAGDAVLVDAAQRLSGCLRESDTVARLGGDEFAILLQDVTCDQVETTCRRVLQALGSGAEVAGHLVPLSTSIGVAMAETGQTAAHLLRNADMAMYEAKALGKDRSVRYERALGRARVRRLELVESLRAAVAARELQLAYQPVVDLQTGRIVGVEALARWNCDGVAVPPDAFISAAEESGLVVSLGDLVLDLAAADAAALRRAAGGFLNIGVNVSAQQLCCGSFVQKVEQTVARMDGVGLVLEITERDFVNDHAGALDTMARLSEQGIPFAIDDFGVGFSSIGYLQHTPVRIIKTDKSLSAEIDRDERACGLLRSIMVMGEALGLDVVVEGIERDSQIEHLRDHVDATLGQGYLLHRPLPLDAVVQVLRKNRGRTVIAPAELTNSA